MKQITLTVPDEYADAQFVVLVTATASPGAGLYSVTHDYAVTVLDRNTDTEVDEIGEGALRDLMTEAARTIRKAVADGATRTWKA